MSLSYLEPTQASGAALVQRQIEGEIMMLNLLRLRVTADYSMAPHLQPPQPISGREAFQRYIDHTLPFLKDSGGEILLLAEGGSYFIGPEDEHWDLAMLIKQSSLQSFFAFASNPEYQKGIGHRSAALVDSRLLPLAAYDGDTNKITS